ncbi:MAG: hypothetical protein PHP10_06385 [Candidatus Omnitrophica bacterium]|nr:hypothetical protein [Candidatus Omnitrophota bacterium]
MRKLILSGIGVVLALSASVALLKAEELAWEEIGRENSNIQCLLVGPGKSGIIFAGSFGCVLKSEDFGKSWRRVLNLSSKSQKVNQILFDPANHNIVYAAADNGLYRSNNLGKRWERVFKGRNNDEAQCISLAMLPYTLFLGTKAGLFITEDNGRSWHKQNGMIGSVPIISIDFDAKENNKIYLANLNGVFISSDSGGNWERVFAAHVADSENEEAGDSGDQDKGERSSDMRFLKADINNPGHLYLASAKGIYKSIDRGKSWNKLSEYGLLSRDVLMVCVSADSRVFALTASGVFLYKEDRWKELSFGLAAGKINHLALDDKGILYAAGEKGIFRSSLNADEDFARKGSIQDYLRGEPNIKDLQQAAIKYAEVSPEKISQWRKKAAIKAMLPQLSVGVDRNSTDLWHWEGGSTVNCYDDVLRRGKDTIDWDVSLSWDLGDLIWNDAQTSIDVRSRLMDKLRHSNISTIAI